MSIDSIASSGAAFGEFELDDALQLLRRKWRSGEQIVLLLGSGLSAQSGYPTLGPLSKNLLLLRGLSSQEFVYNSGSLKDSGTSRVSEAVSIAHPCFSLRDDGWVSPCLYEEMFFQSDIEVLNTYIKAALRDEMLEEFRKSIRGWSVEEKLRFVQGALGESWYRILDGLAGSTPHLRDSLFDDIGEKVRPGAAHSLLAQFINWFNVQLILTTNFDSLIERSLIADNRSPHVFDVQLDSSPPDRELIRKHISVVKLHGTNYSIRADRTINNDLDEGHKIKLCSYIDQNALLLVMGYGGGDKRVMQYLKALIELKDLNVIRVDDLNPSRQTDAFHQLRNVHAALANPSRSSKFYNFYYPHSRLFLLEAYQRCSGTLPSSRISFPAVPYSPAPFTKHTTLGYGLLPPDSPDVTPAPPDSPDVTPAPPDSPDVTPELPSVRKRDHVEQLDKIVEQLKEADGMRFFVVQGDKSCGVSDFLSQIAEHQFTNRRLIWCDLDEAVSVGTIQSWLHEVILGMQPALPLVPLPYSLPFVDPDSGNLSADIPLEATATALWDRVSREEYLIIFDSLSYALSQSHHGPDGARRNLEANRILLFIAHLAKLADECGRKSCAIVVGTHHLDESEKRRLVTFANHNNPELGEIVEILLPLAGSTDKRSFVLPSRTEPAMSESEASRPLPLGAWKNFEDHYKRFLFECSLCNRPRSWSQLLALPVVDDLWGSVKFATDGAVRNIETVQKFRILSALLAQGEAEGKLQRQQGGFYYMQYSTREKLRSGEGLIPAKSIGSVKVKVHNKMLRYYERVYNHSGDVSALNHAYWHCNELLVHGFKGSKSSQFKHILRATGRILLENSSRSRGHLVAYDHCFLLLRLRDHLIKAIEDNPRDTSWPVLLASIENVLIDLYESNEDARNGFALIRIEPGRKQLEDTVRYWHEVQKIHSRRQSLYKSVAAALKALSVSEDLVDLLAKCEENPATDTVTGDQVGSLFSSLTYLVSSLSPSNQTYPDWTKLSKAPSAERIRLYHRTILRLLRVLVRLFRFADSKISVNHSQVDNPFRTDLAYDTISNLVKFGFRMLAQDDARLASESKLVWSRYHSVKALLELYRLDTNRYRKDGLSRLMYFTSMSRSYAVQHDGILGRAYAAIASLQMVEGLVWEGRVLLGQDESGPNYLEAKARQEAAIRELADIRQDLLNSRMDVVWWREMTIIQTLVHLDCAKREMLEMGGYLDSLLTGRFSTQMPLKQPEENLRSAAATMLQLAKDLRFLQPIMRNDLWRTVRLEYQYVRLYTYLIILSRTVHKSLTDSATSTVRLNLANRALTDLIRVQLLCRRDAQPGQAPSYLGTRRSEEDIKALLKALHDDLDHVRARFDAAFNLANANTSGLDDSLANLNKSVAKMREFATQEPLSNTQLITWRCKSIDQVLYGYY